jgi:hypothetical protein
MYKSGIEYDAIIFVIFILPHELGCDVLGHIHPSFHLTPNQLLRSLISYLIS